MKKVALFFGSFNPIHTGHLIMANGIAQMDFCDEVWLVVSPKNPLKAKESLLEDYHRLYLTNLAVEDNELLRVSDIEFHLPKPSFTVDTLAHLREKYPQNTFSLIVGEDNLRGFHKWKNFEAILQCHHLIVYPRVLQENELAEGKSNKFLEKYQNNITRLELPILNISSSHIRQMIAAGKDIRYLVSEKVKNYIEEMHFYAQ